MEKNTAIAIGLSSAVLLGFMYLNTKLAPPPAAQKSSDVAVSSGSQNTSTQQSEQTQTQEKKSFNVTSADVNDTQDAQEFTIETNKAKIVFTNCGGDVISYQLKDYIDNETKQQVQMADNITKINQDINRAFALSFGDSFCPINNDIYKTYISKAPIAIKFSKDYIINNSPVTLSKIYTFKEDDYAFKLDIEIQTKDTKALKGEGVLYTLRTAPQIGPQFDVKNKRYEYRNFISKIGDKKKTKILADNKLEFQDKSTSWTGVTGKYFALLVLPQNPAIIGDVGYSTKVQVQDYPNNQVFLQRKSLDLSLDSANKITDTYYIYIGPRKESELAKYNKPEANAWGLYDKRLTDAMQTSGFLSWLEVILKFIMELVNRFVHNWGVSIIITTLFLKLILFPLTKKSSLSTVKMQELQPQMQALQDKYKDNPQKLNEAMAKFYKQAGYNPLSGCLPLLIQFPILIAMYNLFNNYFEFRGSLFIPGWITDLSQPDTVFVLGFNIPFLGRNIRALPVIYVISQLLFGKITSNGGATAGQNSGQMKMMMYIMPVMFFFLFYNVSSGLLLYWTVSNIFTLVQQLVINNMLKKQKELNKNKNVIKFPKKK